MLKCQPKTQEMGKSGEMHSDKTNSRERKREINCRVNERRVFMKLNQKQRNWVLCLHVLIAVRWESMAGGTVHTLKTTATDKNGLEKSDCKGCKCIHFCLPPSSSLSALLQCLRFPFFLPTMSYDHTDEQTSINIKNKTWNIKPDREHHHKQEKNGGKKWWRKKWKEKYW